MRTKVFEIRDRRTFIPAIAVKLMVRDELDGYLLHRAGYRADDGRVLLARLVDGSGRTDPYDWHNRTMKTAHCYIDQHFDELENGAVIDVEHILGETTQPKRSEREDHP